MNSVVDKLVDESDGALRNSARWPRVEGNPEVAAATVHQLAGYGWVNRSSLVAAQLAVIDQLVLIKIPRHARTLLLSPVTRPEPKTSCFVFGW